MTGNILKRNNRKGQKIGLVRTISVLFLLFYTFTAMVGFYSCYHFIRKSELETEKERTVRVEQTLTTVENYLDNCYEQATSLYQMANTEYSFSSYEVLEKLAAKRTINNNLTRIMELNDKIKMLYYLDQEKNIDLHNFNCTAAERAALGRLIDTDELIKGSSLDSDWHYAEYEGYQYLYILNRNGDMQIGIFLGLQELFSTCRQLVLSEEEGFLVHYAEEEILTGGYKAGSLSEKLVKNKIFERSVEGTDLTYSYYYRSQRLRELYDSTVLFSVVFLIMELGFCFYSYLFMKKFFVKPLNSISSVMKEVEEGDYQVRADLDKANSQELMQFAATFNRMLDEVVNLRMETYEQLLREQNDRLTMLRSQLRPHFYLNAINTINSMTYKGDNAEHIREYLFALSNHMRFMMRTNVNMVPLIDELKNVEAYIKLQEFRGECTYNYYIDCEEGLERLSVPYLILYTFIDNVFKYGIKTKDSFFVMIECKRGYLEDMTPVAILSMEDNGSGFPEEYLEAFNKDEIYPKEDGHIGLYNIRKTLELIYKRSDMMHIENTMTGARVEVRIINESINR